MLQFSRNIKFKKVYIVLGNNQACMFVPYYESSVHSFPLLVITKMKDFHIIS